MNLLATMCRAIAVAHERGVTGQGRQAIACPAETGRAIAWTRSQTDVFDTSSGIACRERRSSTRYVCCCGLTLSNVWVLFGRTYSSLAGGVGLFTLRVNLMTTVGLAQCTALWMTFCTCSFL